MINPRSIVLYQDSPESLITLCLRSIISRYKDVDFHRNTLPQEIGELLASAFRDDAIVKSYGAQDCHSFFSRLNSEFVPMRVVNLSELPIKEETFKAFSDRYGHMVEELDISNCSLLNDMGGWGLKETLTKYKDCLHSLVLGDLISKRIYNKLQMPWMDQEPIIPNLKLRNLAVSQLHPPLGADQTSIDKHLSEVILPSMAETLTYLDLSMCSVGDGTALRHLKSLETLILYNSSLHFPRIIWTICRLKNLRTLDLSKQFQETMDPYVDQSSDKEQNILHLLVKRLPRLANLDISCTELVGRKERYISAFESRIDNPFDFLGVFHTTNDAAYRSSLPAKIIAGEANETQILNACQAYMDRPDQLFRALNDLNNLYKTMTSNESFNDTNRAFQVVLPILTKHLTNEQIMMSAILALWIIVRHNVLTMSLEDSRVRRLLASRVLDAMHYHRHSQPILINGSWILHNLPELIYEYKRVSAISLMMCRDTCPRQRGHGTILLNSLACQVSGEQKVYMGELGAIETMMNIINEKIKEQTSDDTLETAWSALWNITDETPVNCLRFLDCDGLEAFKSCMDIFSGSREVLRNIMGLLGNVAECKELRAQFMKEDIINRFYYLLSSNIDEIECSCNAGGILAHIISDGEEFWYQKLPNDRVQRSIILARMRKVIDSWPINSKRNINYRSFSPIVKLIEPGVAPEAQYWAVFALTNLTRVNPSKYCPMLIPNDGLKMLRRLAETPDLTKSFVANLAKIAVYQYDRFQAEKTLAGLEQCKSTDLEVVKNFRAEPSTSGDETSEMGEVY